MAHGTFVFCKNGVNPARKVSVSRNRCLTNQVGEVRDKLRQSVKPTLLIVDAQTVKNSDARGRKGDDAGKMVSGIKRRIVVDTAGTIPPRLSTSLYSLAQSAQHCIPASF